MIQVKDIVKSFEGNVVLDHVSADFEDGKVNMIIGQSGSGKTVLMKSMIGLHTIDGGEIIFDGNKLQTITGLIYPTIILDNCSQDGVVFSSPISPSVFLE